MLSDLLEEHILKKKLKKNLRHNILEFLVYPSILHFHASKGVELGEEKQFLWLFLWKGYSFNINPCLSQYSTLPHMKKCETM